MLIRFQEFKRLSIIDKYFRKSGVPVSKIFLKRSLVSNIEILNTHIFDWLYPLLEIQSERILGQRAHAHTERGPSQHCLEWWKVRLVNVHQEAVSTLLLCIFLWLAAFKSIHSNRDFGQRMLICSGKSVPGDLTLRN